MKKIYEQGSVEFFLLFMIIITILAIFLFFSAEIQNTIGYLNKYKQSSLVASKISNAAFSAVNNEGMVITLEIPFGYEISVQPGALLATEKSSNVSSSWPIPHVNVSKTISENATVLNVSFVNQTLYIIG
jgi:hypothetical protein